MPSIVVVGPNDNDWRVPLGWSSRILKTVVWPTLGPKIGGGDLLCIEEIFGERTARLLDMLAGIDAWQIVKPHEAMRGVAGRVQKVTAKAFNSFTIRLTVANGGRTEWEKRRWAVEHAAGQWLFPALTVQGYVEKETERLISAGCVRTRDLIRHKLETPQGEGWDIQENGKDGNEFIYVNWSVLQAKGLGWYV